MAKMLVMPEPDDPPLTIAYKLGRKDERARNLFTIRLQLAVILFQCTMMIWIIHKSKETVQMVDAGIKQVNALHEEMLSICKPGRP